jgi:hypothetical protein
MFQRDLGSTRRATSLTFAGLAVAVVTCAVVIYPSEAAAQGFFEAFFGAFRQPSALPGRTQSYADPPAAVAVPEAPSGRAIAYCVRLCDGRYFPIQHHVSATPIQLCNALCPASKTRVFSGGEIHGAVGTDGSRYADLANAFVFRERLVANCTCNGKDAFGLAPLDVAVDPTLRPGDVIATENGLMTVTGAKSRKGASADFTPVEKSGRSPETRRKLTVVTAAPAR